MVELVHLQETRMVTLAPVTLCLLEHSVKEKVGHISKK